MFDHKFTVLRTSKLILVSVGEHIVPCARLNWNFVFGVMKILFNLIAADALFVGFDGSKFAIG